MSIKYPIYELPGINFVQYQNAVLETYERNGYDDSDFFAIVWDAAENCTKSIEYATTRFGGGGWADVDATPEVRALADQHYIKTAVPGILRESAYEARLAAKGKVCRVIKGRKIAKGTIVEVIGDAKGSKYSMGRFAQVTYNVLVRLPNGDLIHTNRANLEVIAPEQYEISEAAALAQATEAVRRAGNCRSKSFVGIPARLVGLLR